LLANPSLPFGVSNRQTESAVSAPMMMPPYPFRPFIKWAGGKRQLLRQYFPYLPLTAAYDRYFEPFLGGGALFFHLQPTQAILGDVNAELINSYQIVRDHPEALLQCLQQYQPSKQDFYCIRALDPKKLSPIESAARFIYLNKTCYNGLYRVNRRGHFNVPYGRLRSNKFFDSRVIRAASHTLQGAQLLLTTFEQTLQSAGNRDFVYLDPPYLPTSSTAKFTHYTADMFIEEDQIRLAQEFYRLHAQGCLIMLSNSETPLIRELYKDFEIIPVACPRPINSKVLRRQPVTELLIRNF
jgi:DNA adenine methylase